MLSPDVTTSTESVPTRLRPVSKLAAPEQDTPLPNIKANVTEVDNNVRLRLWMPMAFSAPPAVTPLSSNASVPQPAARHSRSTRRRPGLRPIPAQEKFWQLAKWQGQVLSVSSDTFEAQVLDAADPNLIERATFQKAELNPDSLQLLRPGATFYWFVGYRDLPDGQRRRELIIWMSVAAG